MSTTFDMKGYVIAGDGERVNFNLKDDPNLFTDSLHETLKRAGNVIEAFKDEGMDDVGKAVVGIARARAPEDTGNLRKNIEYTNNGGNLEITSSAIDEHTGHDYAPVQEFGGQNDEGKWVEAQPYFYPAVDDVVQGIQTYMASAIEEGIDTEYMPSFGEYMKSFSKEIRYGIADEKSGGGGESFSVGGRDSGVGIDDLGLVGRFDDIGFPGTKSAANKLVDPEGGYGSSFDSGFGDFNDAGYWLGRD